MAKVVSGSVSVDDDCRPCDLKAEFNRQINASSSANFITPPFNCFLHTAFAAIKKWSIGDSNPWPPHCQCGALPAALMPRANAILPYFSENASTFLKNLRHLRSPVKRVRFMLYFSRVRRSAARGQRAGALSRSPASCSPLRRRSTGRTGLRKADTEEIL